MRTAYEIERDRQVNSIINGVFQEQSKRVSLPKREYWEMEISKLESLIEKHLNISGIEIIAEDELHNGYTPCHSMVAEDNTEGVDKFRNKEKWAFMGLHQWIEHLIFLNVLPEGNYIIDHSW